MPVKPIKSRKLIAEVEAAGWVHIRTTGSHFIFKHPTHPGKVVIPHHSKDIPGPTARAIRRDAGLIK